MGRERQQWSASDARSGRVVFLSHCLLNENVRYPGGATVAGAIPGIASGYLERGVGLCQMPCPEQAAWGGVRKRHLVRLAGQRSLCWRPLRRVALAMATAWTALVYRRLARRVADEIVDYLRSGFEVVEYVGVGGSPSCGVHTTLDLDGAVKALACMDGAADRRVANRDVVAANVTAGRGMFVAALEAALRSQKVSVSLREHDLVAELADAGAVAP